MRFTVLLLTLCCLFTQSDRKQRTRGNKPPVVAKIEATPGSLTYCEQPTNGEIFCQKGNRTTVTLTVSAKDPEGGSLTYKWSSNVGEIVGEGSQVTWNLAQQKFGLHEAKVIVSDSDGEETAATVKVAIELCQMCVFGELPCPNVVVKSRSEVAHRAEKLVFYTEVDPNRFFESRPDYLWAIKGGKILKGQHSPQVEVEVTAEISSEVTAIVEVGGLHPACSNSNQVTVQIRP